MIPIVKKIHHLGTQEIKEDYKVGVVKISNIIAFIFLMAGVIYGAISVYLAPQLVNVCVFLLAGSAAILLLNYMQMVDISRFFLNLVVSAVVAIYHAYVVQPGESIIISIYVGQLVVALLPWIYIDIRETKLLISTLAITLTIFVIQPWTNDIFNIEMDSSIFRDSIFTIPTYTLSIMALLFCMYLLQTKNLNSERGAKSLLEDVQARNQEMEEQQAQLMKTLEENKKVHEAEERRNWMSSGISEISSELRGEINKELYQRIVTAIVKFMKINQVGIYVVEQDEESGEEHPYIEMKSCYAYDRVKYLKKRIEIGEGLVGQCYLEREPMYLKEVPESYINVTSGLGDASPRCILIVPLIHENHVEGILEIASFNELQDHEIKFMQRLSGTLASFISSNRINLKTKMLLEISQEQSEQMRAQEEEMRQNMEEMQATQESIHRKEQEYLARIKELETELKQFKVTQ